MIHQPLPRALPEEVGIPSGAVTDFINEINEKHLGLQSFTLVRHGKIAAQCFWKPYDADIPHVLYSMSKSVTSTAIGFAVSEGLLSVDDKVADFFPEYRIMGLNKELTVRHLLTMRSDKLITVLTEKGGTDWIKQFFDAPFLIKPDHKFNYISENTHMLSAIITKITGQTLVDYLYPRIFEPLGIEKPFWETDGNGVAAGGWGLYMKSEDLAKFFLVYLNRGVYNGKRILPESWIEEATTYQTDTLTKGAVDNVCGYGYQFWRNHIPNSYRADGLFGQRCILLPDKDALMVLNSGQAEDYYIMDVFWKHFPGTMCDTQLPADPAAYEKMIETIENCSVEKLPAAPRNYAAESAIENRKISCSTSEFVSILTNSITQMLYRKPGKISEMKFNFKDASLLFAWKEKNYENTIEAGMDGTYGVSEMTLGDLHYTAYSTAAWQPDGTLKLWIRPIETAHVRQLTFDFSDLKNIKIDNFMTPKFSDLAVYYMSFTGHPVKNKDSKKAVKTFVKTLGLPIIEPGFKGKIE